MKFQLTVTLQAAVSSFLIPVFGSYLEIAS